MARCQHTTFVSLQNPVHETCGAPATWMGKEPFRPDFKYRCDEHASDLRVKMPIQKQPDATRGSGGS